MRAESSQQRCPALCMTECLLQVLSAEKQEEEQSWVQMDLGRTDMVMELCKYVDWQPYSAKYANQNCNQ